MYKKFLQRLRELDFKHKGFSCANPDINAYGIALTGAASKKTQGTETLAWEQVKAKGGRRTT